LKVLKVLKVFDYSYLLFLKRAAYLFSFLILTSISQASWKSMLVIGDSAASGAASSPEITLSIYDFSIRVKDTVQQLLISMAFSKDDQRARIAKLSYVPDNEFFQMTDMIPPVRIWWNSGRVEKFLTKMVDYEQLSWAYLLGRKLGVSPFNIYYSVRDGKRSSDFVHQVERFLAYTGNQLPETVLVQFTGNDLCHPSIFAESNESVFQRVFSAYIKGIDALKKGKVSVAGEKVNVFIMPSIDIAQHLDNEDILATRVPVSDQEFVTCLEVRRNQYNNSNEDIDMLIGRLPRMCPSILNTSLENKENIQIMRDKVAVVRRAQAAAVEYAGKEPFFSAVYVKHFEGFHLKAGEIANDCFHIGAKGNARIAQEFHQLLQDEE